MEICPVCGYDRMLRPPAAGYICPCCGVEFELDDDGVSHEALRKRWIMHGMPWFSQHTVPPANWNPLTQLSMLGPLVVVESHMTTVSEDTVHGRELERFVPPAYIIQGLGMPKYHWPTTDHD